MENKLYNPAAQPKDWLIGSFVARTQIFEKIFNDLLTGKMKYPEQHYLIQGQRGMGKTTLLLRLKYEVENTPELNEWLVPVFFNEESYDLTSLSNLWEKLLKYLDNLWDTGGVYYGKTSEFVSREDYEKKCFEFLISILKDKKKKLVIFFDNFGQLFLDNLKEKEQRRLREILMNCNDIRIVGASAVVLHDLHDYSKPFFEFFKIISLEGLNKDETLQLISKLQESSPSKIDIEKNKGKIETLAILTGGVIRTIMLIYEVILADEDGTALRDLETILDRITPLYKHRIEDLPVQQRKIIDVIAKRWDAISTKEIAENIREDGKPMATKLISAQLQQLEKNNVIEKKQTNTKNHLYQLKERFFNIWYLMRNGDRFDRCRVMWLTKFLEAWYDDNADIESFIKKHIELLKSGKYYVGSAMMVAEALANSTKLGYENKLMLVKATREILNEEQEKMFPKLSVEKEESAFLLFAENRFEESLHILRSLDYNSFRINTLLFSCYLNLKETEKAISSIEKNNKLKPYLLGLAYLQLADFNNAVKFLKEALKTDFGNVLPKAIIFKNLGDLYKFEKQDPVKAIQYYKEALNLVDDDLYKKIINTYIELEDYNNAEKIYLIAVEAELPEVGQELIEEYIFKFKDIKKASELISHWKVKDFDNGTYFFYAGLIAFLNPDGNEDKKAEQNLLKAKEIFEKNNNKSTHYKVACLFLLDIYVYGKNKIDAIKISNEIDATMMPEYTLKAIVYIWNNQFKAAFEAINQFMKIVSENESNDDHIELLLLLLLAKKQFHFTFKLFENNSLNFKDKYKPLYYALMNYLQDEYPNEYLKMGTELQQPVNDVMERIKELAIEYA
jgi:hypothetical protein